MKKSSAAIFFCLLAASMSAYSADQVTNNQSTTAGDMKYVPDQGGWVPADQNECTEWCHPYWKSMPKLEYVFFTAEAADCSTTLDIKNHPGYYEENPLLGRHPSDGRVIGSCIAAGLLHSAITYELVDGGAPKGLITAWELISIGTEGYMAGHNLSMGLRFRF